MLSSLQRVVPGLLHLVFALQQQPEACASWGLASLLDHARVTLMAAEAFLQSTHSAVDLFNACALPEMAVAAPAMNLVDLCQVQLAPICSP